MLDLLAAAAKNKRVAAFETQHAVALEGIFHQLAVNVVLGDRVIARSLAHVDALRIAAHQVEHFF